MGSLQEEESTNYSTFADAIMSTELKSSCTDLLYRCFHFEQSHRITAKEATEHHCLRPYPSEIGLKVSYGTIDSSSSSGVHSDGSCSTLDLQTAQYLQAIPDTFLQQLRFLQDLEKSW